MPTYSFIASGKMEHTAETEFNCKKIKRYLFPLHDFRAYENDIYDRYKVVYFILKRIKSSPWGTTIYFI